LTRSPTAWPGHPRTCGEVGLLAAQSANVLRKPCTGRHAHFLPEQPPRMFGAKAELGWGRRRAMARERLRISLHGR
jgi:hypothetical protein